MIDPRSTSPGSNMPAYDWLKTTAVDFDGTGKKMHTLRALGVPYTDADITSAKTAALSQGRLIVDDLAEGSVELTADSKLTALIAYLQRLGRGPQPTGIEGSTMTEAPEMPSGGERQGG
jgi:cytochrome c oxidase cbb3-type subunit I/II